MTALANDLTGLGMSPGQASRLGIRINSITGVGTTQGGTSPIVYGGDYALLTSAAGATACTIDSSFPVGDSANVVNISTVTGLLFPPTSGTINGGTANASINIPPRAVVVVTRTSATAFWVEIGVAGGTSSVVLGGATDAVTAFATGGQTNATQLTGLMSSVTTVGTAADSVKLPLAQAGMVYFLANATATSMTVYGAGTDTINGVATATGVAQGANSRAAYFAITSAPAGKWFRVLSA